MNTTQDRRRVRRTWLRSGLLVVAATPLACGLWALLFPRAFYDDFPLPGSDWVSTLGPHNEHLVRDYGALNLAMAVLLLAAGVLLERRLMQVALLSCWSSRCRTSSFTWDRLTISPPGSNLAQLGGLGLLILLPLVLLFLPPQKGAGRDLVDTKVDRTERIQTR